MVRLITSVPDDVFRSFGPNQKQKLGIPRSNASRCKEFHNALVRIERKESTFAEQ